MVKRNFWNTIGTVLIFLGSASEVLGIKDASNQGRWDKPTKVGPDAKVPGFLVNMGPTGARGILKERSYVVKYIFAKSPADGVLELDDEVYGANGKKFSTGNRPVEMLLPMLHLKNAGFNIDIVTPSGKPVKIEMKEGRKTDRTLRTVSLSFLISIYQSNLMNFSV